MPKWTPKPIWKDQDAYIIGGGPSLREFDWSLLEGLRTIGCNKAYVHGPSRCEVCLFGDVPWWDHHKHELERYTKAGGTVFTNASALKTLKVPWLWTMRRENSGLYCDALGWNTNTGMAAINLALIFGAKTLYLLGFDMGLGKDGKSNWHEDVTNKFQVLPASYVKFFKAWPPLLRDMQTKFSDRRLVNVSDLTAVKDAYGVETVKPEEFWKGRRDVLVEPARG